MGLWWRILAYVRWVVGLLTVLAKVIGCLGILGVAFWLQSGWGSHIRRLTVWVSEKVWETSRSFVPGLESKICREIIDTLIFIWDNLKGPLAELVIAAVSLGVRCTVYITLYVVSGAVSVFFFVVANLIGYTAYAIQECLHSFCLDACNTAWGEIACIILC